MGAKFARRTLADPEAVDRQRKLDKDFADKQKSRRVQDAAVTKLLLVGTGESGKSTLFRQIVKNYGEGISADERRSIIPSIYRMLFNTMQTFYKQADVLKSEMKAEADETLLAELAIFKDIDYSSPELSKEKAALIKKLWETAFLKELYSLRFGRYYMLDSAEYFLNKATDVVRPDYIPDDNDLVRIREKTTGIHYTEFNILGSQMLLVDVGGQRNERRKWLHCFDGVTVVLYVVGLSEYDQKLYEDDTVNRLDESLETFDSVINSAPLAKINVILLLNKKDLFEEKIKRVPLTYALPKYDGPERDFQSAVDYIDDSFRRLNKTPTRAIYTHITCATDGDLVKKLFESIRDTVVRISLEAAAL